MKRIPAAVFVALIALSASSAEIVKLLEVAPAPNAKEAPLIDDARVASYGNVVYFILGESLGWFSTNTARPQIEMTALPKELAQLIDRPGIQLLADSGNSVWVVHREARQFWRWSEAKEWSEPQMLGFPLTSAAISRSELIAGAASGSPPFRIVTSNGKSRGFGEALRASVPELDELANRWLIAAGPDGQLAAANMHVPVVRIYSADRKHVRLVRLAEAPLNGKVDVDPATCCTELEVRRFATALATTDDEIWIRPGLEPRFIRFDWAGEPKEDVVVRTDEDPWLIAGATVSGSMLFVRDHSGISSYALVERSEPYRVTVIRENGEPVEGARVGIESENGRSVSSTTGTTGQIETVVVGKDDHGRIEVSAPGFQRVVRSGRLSELTRIVLARSPEVCVSAADRLTGKPVTRFELAIRRLEHKTDSAFLATDSVIDVESKDGTSCISADVAFPWVIGISSAGYARGSRRVSNEDPVAFELEPEARASFVTTDPDGLPVPGVTLLLFPESRAIDGPKAYFSFESTVSDNSGEATFHGFEKGQYSLVAEHADYLRISGQPVSLPTNPPVSVQLEHGATLAVTAVSEVDKAPIAGVSIVARSLGSPTGRRLDCVTDDSGSCTIDKLPLGDFVLLASIETHAEAQELVTVSPLSADISVVIRLNRGVRLTGTIRGLEHYPGVEPRIAFSVPGKPLVRVPASRDGEFMIDSISPGRASIWIRDGNSQKTLLYTTRQIPDERESHMQFLLSKPIVISGHVMLGSYPCGDCLITASKLGGGISTGGETMTSLNGNYSLSLTEPGLHRFLIEESSRDQKPSEKHTEIVDIERSMEKNFALGKRIDIRVTDDLGRHVGNADVQIVSAEGVIMAEGRTTSAGELTLPRPTGMAVQVSARHENMSGTRQLGPDDPGPVMVRIADHEGTIRVLDRAGRIVPAVDILVAKSGSVVSYRKGVPTDVDGFVSTGAIPGSTLVLSATAYATKTVHDWASGATIVMDRPGRSFTVRVDDSIRSCAIELRDSFGRSLALRSYLPPAPVPFNSTDALFTQVEPGSYMLILVLCSGEHLTRTFTLQKGLDTSVTFD